MAVIEISRIQVRRGRENQTGIPTLAGGEFGWASDTENLYIGLRREDGGSRDANIRVLTENDILDAKNIFSDLVTAYTYRDQTDPPITGNPNTQIAFVRSLNEKADDFVSIKDFGVIGEGGDAVESELIQNAIDRLFLDPLKNSSAYGPHTAKVLWFPAGTYNIDQAILVPGYTTIMGEGIGKTIINLISTSSHAIQTIDADINYIYTERVTFETGNMTSGHGQPNYIRIEGVTIQYDQHISSVQGCFSLISLDCSENAVIKDVRLEGRHLVGDFADAGHSGIDIRGFSSSENLTISSNNILIDNCEFDGLYYCVLSNYDIVNPIIQNSQFYNSVRGVTFNDPRDEVLADAGPRGGRILNNRFMNIERHAIFVGDSNPSLSTNHISMNNRFYNVGNYGLGRDSDFGTPVITYIPDGNLTINDWFDRDEYINQNINTVQKYIKLVEGRAVINNPGVKTVILNTGNNKILRLPITSLSQLLTINYSMTLGIPGAYSIDRIGTLKVYIQPGDNPDVTNIVDEYSYNIGNATALEWTLYVDPANTFYDVSLFIVEDGLTLEYQTNLMI